MVFNVDLKCPTWASVCQPEPLFSHLTKESFHLNKSNLKMLQPGAGVVAHW